MADIEITGQKVNNFLGRTEIQFKIAHAKEATPKRDLIREKIATVMNTSKENVVVTRMTSKFGFTETCGYAKVYKTKDQARTIESDYILKRNGLYVEKKKREPKAEGEKK